MVMFAVQNMTDVDSAHVTVLAEDLKCGMTVQVTDTDTYRDSETDQLVWIDQTWQGTVLYTDNNVWNVPKETYVGFVDGPAAWIIKGTRVPLVMGPVNSHGKF